MDFAPRGSQPDRTIPRFHLKPVEIPFKSREAGRPIFEDREFVEIIVPGNARSIPIEPVNDEHKKRWPQHYEAFKKGLELPTTGTPLEQWSAITPATVQNMKSLNLRTVEDLAAASDSVLQALGHGGHDFRRRAQAFLDQAAGNAPNEALLAENERLKAELEMVKGQVADLAALVEDYTAPSEGEPERRGPGRPRKAA